MAATKANVKLCGTAFCHLCAEAEEIFHQAGIAAINIDIAGDSNLFERYSLRIPVLQRDDNDAELDWPFDAVAVTRFLT